ncbi:MAG TPA: glycosyltransferase [Thiotrichaceae bacterium]|nr:glycosyltransferase [Thiotrichaceae bacterium]
MTAIKNQNSPTILIIDATLPTYDQDSGSLRLLSLIKMLVKMGYQLTFFHHDRYTVHFKYRYALEALGVDVFRGNINALLTSRQFTLAWLCRVHVAHRYIPLLRLLNPDTHIFYDTVDIHYIREQRRAEIEDNPSMAERAVNTKRKELSNCQLANRVITVTPEDGQHLQQALPQLPFSVIPNIHQRHALPDTPVAERKGLVFIGHYRHKPNEDAVCYFAETVLPKIHTTQPDINFYVVGSYMTTPVKDLASSHVKIVGWVDQVEPEFAQRRVFVSPLRYGAGMKGKIGQALSLGLPVVTTSIGAEGMGLIDGETVLIADDPDSFAEAVCRLYTDSALWEKLSRQGQDYIEQHYGETAVYEKLRQLLVAHKLLPTAPVPDFSEKVLPTTELILPKWVSTVTLPIVLPDVPSPRVSIVIPVFNQALYTYNCLLTLQACDQTISKEVIIINNASTDETAELLAQLQGAFTILNNEENQGFVHACRQGAEVARGEFILFLNNDTQVMPGWLSNSLKAMDSDQTIGITGSKLIYPDGRLQEAGGIIFNDASGYHYGRSQNPLLPQFNQNRIVDYCSGASLMIRKSLWAQLGGFDLRYAPAYYEDTDLCFAARQAGYQVLYCHNSEVIHHEGKTAGTDINSGYKAFQAVNRKKFQEKWQAVLSTHLPPLPHSSVEVAAFRLQESKVASLQETGAKTQASEVNTFRIPEQKIKATHLVGQGWACNFWSYLNINQIDEELNFIKSQGFNTVIILVPWVGFQTHVDPITYHEEYFSLFEQLLKKVQDQGLQIILRLGYTHDHGPESEPDGFLRACVVGNNAVIWQAWCDYLDRLWAIAKSYSNVLGGFLSWEDFALILITQGTEEERLLYAERTGYQNYLAQHYTLEALSARYRQTFTAYSEIPIPAIKSNTTHLFCEFWDHLLIDKIVKESKAHFPRLTLEVRVDCDPQGRSYVCHTRTFEVNSDIPLTMVYYTPAWGAPNDGHPTSAVQALNRMLRFFNWLRAHTKNALFIDQFNFIDNTPCFEQNTRILPAELPHFLSEAALIIQHNTIGYSLWTLRDVPVNVIRNGVFERNYPSWAIEKGEIIFDAVSQKKAVFLNSTGTLSQTITNNISGIQIVKEKPFKLDFKVKKVENEVKEKASMTVLMLDDKQQALFEETVYCESDEWQAIHLEPIFCDVGYALKIENRGTPILLSDFYLYQTYQENGIIDSDGNQKSFYNDLISLNQKL